MTEALPICIGAMIFGGIGNIRIDFGTQARVLSDHLSYKEKQNI